MVRVLPFHGIRPNPKVAHKVASVPYDVISTADARKEAKANPLTWLRVVRSEVDLDESVDPHSEVVYAKARENLETYLQDGTLQQDEKQCFYFYRQAIGNKQQTSIVGTVTVDDYNNDIIKKHEKTLAEKEKDRINHIDKTDAHAGPVFLTSSAEPKELMAIMAKYTAQTPEYDFTAVDGVQHTFWVCNDDEDIDTIASVFQSDVPSLYIADGHHRAASASRVGNRRREAAGDSYTGNEGYGRFLAAIFPKSELNVMAYNRVTKDLGDYKSTEEFLEALREQFVVEKKGSTGSPYTPTKKGQYGFYLEGNWYSVWSKSSLVEGLGVLESLDVKILQDRVLSRLLKIDDPRTNKRVAFVGGIKGTEELERLVDAGEMKLAINMFPTSIEDLIYVSDKNQIMPPKSTWFEPKLRSGMVVSRLTDNYEPRASKKRKITANGNGVAAKIASQTERRVSPRRAAAQK
eukprot:GFYU01002172.1.p1 GENE.GFYU01002172.1~~GFYU01002172.1.p1  ORF type:complete len:462 (+),score=148.83 GFYU01002172.1:177-1562(+)